MIKILKFEGAWCSPCKAMKPILTAFSSETGILVESIDIDKHEKLVDKYNIRAVPTIIFLKDNVEVERISGLTQKDKLISLLEKHNK
jgi:thioredoxin 1